MLGHITGSQLCRCHIPLTHKVLQVLLDDLQHGRAQLCHGSEGKERQHPVRSTTPSYFIDLFLELSFFSAVWKEAGRRWEITREDVGCAGVTASIIAPWHSNRGGKVVGLHGRGKKAQ
jgi:hypothetical protein